MNTVSRPRSRHAVLESRLESSSDSDGTTYRLLVRYEYVFDGRKYVGDRYNFALGSSGGHESKMRLVQSLPPGRRVTCWVDPAKPWISVIDRTPPGDLWFGLFPLVFVAIGGALMFAPERSVSKGTAGGISSAARRYPEVAPGMNSDRSTGPTELRPRKNTVATLIILLVMAVGWNSILGVIIGSFMRDIRHGSFAFVVGLFSIPFLLVGIALIGAVVYQVLSLFNPRPTILLARATVSPGETDEIRWQFDGRIDSISRLTIQLEGREEATFRRGTTTSTDRNVFYRTELLQAARPRDIANGRRPFTIPAGTMHSFHASNNRIIWSLLIHGEIASWPDVKREYLIDVAPAFIRSQGQGSAMVKLPETDSEPGGRELAIKLEGMKTGYLPGARVAGVARWDLPNPPSEVQVRLFWYTSGKGTRNTGIVEILKVAAPATTGAQRFEFVLPAGPYSFSGKLISLAWAVEVVVEPKSRAAACGADRRARRAGSGSGSCCGIDRGAGAEPEQQLNAARTGASSAHAGSRKPVSGRAGVACAVSPVDWTWDQLLRRLEEMNWRGALVGHKGAGKTTMMEDLAPHLEAAGFRTCSVRLDEDHPTIAPDRLAKLTETIGPDTMVLLDGCEQLTWLCWRRFQKATLRARGIVVTTHLPGRLPTLVRCAGSPAILRRIIVELTNEDSARDIDVNELFRKHRGNIRECAQATV